MPGELLLLVLLLAHDHRHHGFPHPGDLALEELDFLLVVLPVERRLQFADTFLPETGDPVVHRHARELVDADEHGLAGFPRRRVVVDEVLRDAVEAFRRGDDLVVAFQLRFEPRRNIRVQIALDFLEFFGNPLIEVRRVDLQLLPARVVVERHRRAIVHGPLEVVGRNVVAEHAARQLVAFEERRSREADVSRVRQGVAHVERELPVLRPVRLVGDDDDVVAQRVRLARTDLLVELLDEREQVGHLCPDERLQVATARRAARVLVVVRQSAPREGVVDLLVQILAVGQDQEREVPAQLAPNLPREIDHRIALARTLRVPEHAKPAAVPRSAVFHRLHRPVHAEELVVAGEDLRRRARGLVEDDEVFEEVEEVGLGAGSLQQRLHVDDARLLLGEALPGVEELELGRVRADLGVDAVSEDAERVEVEELRHHIPVIAEVVAIRHEEVFVDVLELHEDKRDAVDESDDVRAPPAPQRSRHPELPDAKEMVVAGVVEVKHAEARHRLGPVGRRAFHIDAVSQHGVLPAVDGVQPHRDRRFRQRFHRGAADILADAGVELPQRGQEVARKHDLLLAQAPQRPAEAQRLVQREDALVPAESIDQILRRRLLHEIVFGVGCHSGSS